jgi:ATP-dependent DNA helicase RecQ
MQSWMQTKQVIVATNAFGIDKADVKTVIHQLPENFGELLSRSRDAGRNGEKAFAVLLTTPTLFKLKISLSKSFLIKILK